MKFHFVDDDAVIREFMLALLPDMGHDIQVFSSGASYLEYTEQQGFTLPTAVLTDIQMPTMDGYALTRKLRAKFPYLKIVLVTGNPSYTLDSSKEGCFFMRKPFFPADMGALVGALSCCTYDEDHSSVLKLEHKKCDMGLDFSCPFKRRLMAV
ncbi:MAG: response regulator [Mariprofundales bacterium]